MSLPENLPAGSGPAIPSPQPASTNGLDSRVRKLEETLDTFQRLFQFILITLILFFVAIGVFLFSQVRLLRAQAFELGRAAEELRASFAEFRTNTGPRIVEFSNELHHFAETRPDFASIMAKYPKPSPQAITSNPPAPAAPATPKKK